MFNKLNNNNKKKAVRITFNEISKTAIDKALKNEKNIDIEYVQAYLSRICLDKKMGYGLSNFLRKTAKLSSAGRVQSVVLKLVYDRQKDIDTFVPKTTYRIVPTISGIDLSHSKTHNDRGLFDFEKLEFSDEEKAKQYVKDFLFENKFKMFHVSESKQKISNAPVCFKTSTAQETLIQQLKINSKTAESILQKLYQLGLISYPRTDSTRMSPDFCEEALAFVKKNFGDLANEGVSNKKGSKGKQDAHECIRVTHLEDTFDTLTGLDEKHIDAYKIIYDRTIIQFMKPVISESRIFSFINNKDEFICNDEEVLDQGYLIYLKKEKANKNVNFDVDNIYEADNFDDLLKKSTTVPPKLFKQTSLIKKLEELGIGRPSTFASSVEVNNVRGYTKMDKNGIITITTDGIKAIETLTEV